MARQQHLRNPPIKEALVDLRVEVSSFDPKMLEPLWPSIQQRYPNLEARNQVQMKFRTASIGEPPVPEATDLGFQSLVLRTADESFIAQFRRDGFTVNQLKGYTAAERLFEEALDLWPRYAALVKPQRVVRVALRYLNRLHLPFKEKDQFARFLRAAGDLPEELSSVPVSEFLSRSVLQVAPERQTVAIVTQRLEVAEEKSTPFVLDVDVFCTGDYSTDADYLPILQHLRTIKNDCFFSFITDEALEPYV
jgi:uncharacterized protein (TIGR04255 family)